MCCTLVYIHSYYYTQCKTHGYICCNRPTTYHCLHLNTAPRTTTVCFTVLHRASAQTNLFSLPLYRVKPHLFTCCSHFRSNRWKSKWADLNVTLLKYCREVWSANWEDLHQQNLQYKTFRHKQANLCFGHWKWSFCKTSRVEIFQNFIFSVVM